MKLKLYMLFMVMFVFLSFNVLASSVDLSLGVSDTNFELNHTEGNELDLNFNLTNVTNDLNCSVDLIPEEGYSEISQDFFEFSNGGVNISQDLTVFNISEGVYEYIVDCDEVSSSKEFDVLIENVPQLKHDVYVNDSYLGDVLEFDMYENESLMINLTSINNELVDRDDDFVFEDIGDDEIDTDLITFDSNEGLFYFDSYFDSAGNYSLNFTVIQDDGQDSKVVEFEVYDVNRRPYINFLDGEINKTINVLRGDEVNEEFEFGDLDDDEVEVICDDEDRTDIDYDINRGWINYEVGAYDSDRTFECVVDDGDLNSTIKLEVNVKSQEFDVDLDEELLIEQGSEGRNRRVSKDITITNNIDQNIEVDIFAEIDEDYDDFEFEFRYDGSNYDSLDNFPIDSLSDNEFEVSVVFPDDISLDSKNIGEITFEKGDLELTYDIEVKPSSMLRFDRLEYEVYDDGSGRLRDGDSIDVMPGDEVEIYVELENAFSSSSDIWIEDVELEYTVKSIDDGDDIYDYLYYGDIEADDVLSDYFVFDIPLRVQDTTFDVLLEVEGEDENRNIHEETFEFELDIDKSRDEITIDRFEFDRDSIGCLRYANIDLSLINTGRNNLEEWSYRIESDTVDFSYEEEFDLDSFRRRRDNDYITFSHEVDFEGVSVGEHDFDLRLYDDRGRLEELIVTSVYVDECNGEEVVDELDGECGEEDGKIYDADDTSWDTNNFCYQGTASPMNPIFPSEGGDTSWECLGEDGGSDVTCSAQRLESDNDDDDIPEYIVDDDDDDFSTILILLGVLNIVLVVILVLLLIKVRD